MGLAVCQPSMIDENNLNFSFPLTCDISILWILVYTKKPHLLRFPSAELVFSVDWYTNKKKVHIYYDTKH